MGCRWVDPELAARPAQADACWSQRTRFEGASRPAAAADTATCVQRLPAAWLELEVFDRVGDMHDAAINAGLRRGGIENLPGRADKRRAGEILLITGLFADHDDPRMIRLLAKHGRMAGSHSGQGRQWRACSRR